MSKPKKIKGVRTIDITPTWTGIMPALLTLYSNAKTRDMAYLELCRMALAADQFNEKVKRKK